MDRLISVGSGDAQQAFRELLDQEFAEWLESWGFHDEKSAPPEMVIEYWKRKAYGD